MTPRGKTAPLVALHTTVLIPDASDATTPPMKVATAPEADVAFTITFEQAMVGGVVSMTATLKRQDDERPPLLVTIQVTDVVPSENCDPETGKHEAKAIPLLALAVGVNVADMVGTPLAVAVAMFAGQVMVGGTESTFDTWKEQVAVFRFASVAAQMTVVLPMGKAYPAL